MNFINYSDESKELEIEGPHKGEEDIGAIAGGGAEFIYELKIPEDKLPVTLELEAGGEETEFTVNKYTPDDLWVIIYEDGIDGPRDTP
jgi:hypothetical protein